MKAIQVDPAARIGARGRRRPVGRARPRHPAPRARHHRRADQPHRHRRPDARRRLRAPDAPARPHRRQPARGRAGHRRRRADARRRRDTSPSCSGACAAAAATSASPPRSSTDLHPVGPLVLGGPIFWPLEQAPRVLRFLREFAPRGARRARHHARWRTARRRCRSCRPSSTASRSLGLLLVWAGDLAEGRARDRAAAARSARRSPTLVRRRRLRRAAVAARRRAPRTGTTTTGRSHRLAQRSPTR